MNEEIQQHLEDVLHSKNDVSVFAQRIMNITAPLEPKQQLSFYEDCLTALWKINHEQHVISK